VASSRQNGFVESFCGRSKHSLGDLNRFEIADEMIVADYRHIRCYNYSRIHTALKMPPAVSAAQLFPDSCLHKLGA